MKTQVNLSLEDYINAGETAIVLNTAEEERAIEECHRIAEKRKMLCKCWSETKGIVNISKNSSGEIIRKNEKSSIAPDEDVLKEGMGFKKDTIYCILDFHPYIKIPNVWRTAKDVFSAAKFRKKELVYIFISSKFEVPSELEHDIIITNLELPKKDELKDLVEQFSNKYDINIENMDEILDAALGLTLGEAESAFAISISSSDTFDLDIINNVKRQIICKDGLLEYMRSKETLDTVGGMKAFTAYAKQRFSAYSPEAQEYGLPYPKGVLLVGIPGCGKSLAAKALSNMWQKPLLKLDLGKLFGSLVGDTEANTRKSIQIAEAMAPCILWIDEIEKGLSGVGSSGKTDSGVTSRMFGTILTWLQEKDTPVYVIATANNISSLPAEFLRKGRFDEIFFVDLPNEEEREEIFKIQIKKHKGKSEDFDIEKLARISDKYTGAEIEEAVISSMFYAWNDGKRPYTSNDIEIALSEIKPMAKGIMSKTVESLRKWSDSQGIRKATSYSQNKKDESKENENGEKLKGIKNIRKLNNKEEKAS